MANCPDNTIDSNVTGLAMAEEICPGQLPNINTDGFLPIWYEQEPNSYTSSFGGSLKTVARAPIKQNRQRSKGTTTDKDAAAGWNTDYTQNNLTRALQGFFFASIREKTTTAPLNGTSAVLTGANTNTISGTGMPRFRKADIVALSGTLNNNNALTVNTSSPTALVANEAVVTETFTDDAVAHKVGVKYGASAVAVTVAGGIGTLHLAAAPVAATGALTIDASNASDGDTVTIDGIVYTFNIAAPTVAYDVMIGADETASGANLATTINGGSTLTPAHPGVTAVNAAGVVTMTAKLKGASENAIGTTTDGANLSWANATLTGGTGISLMALGMIPGEWGFLGGDGAGTAFTNNVGYFRVGSIDDTDLVMDRTTWTPQAEAAGALTIEIFVGGVLQNENDPALIVKRSYQMQRTLGKDADGTQSQYIVGAVANQLDLNIPLADKITADLAFIAQTEEFRTGSEGLKPGTLSPALDEDAINTSNDVYEMAMTVINAANSNPTKLFGYLSDAKLTVNNNVSSIKGIGVLGGIGVNVGIFEVSGTATAYFQSVAANVALTNNDDVDCHFIIAKHNAGFVYDMALLSLGGGNIAIDANKPITVPLTTNAAQNKNGSTLSYTIFGYLPNKAMPEAA